MTTEELYLEALLDRKSILIERGGYHSIVSGGYKIIKDLNINNIRVVKRRGDYYEEFDSDILLKNGWRKGINMLNSEKI